MASTARRHALANRTFRNCPTAGGPARDEPRGLVARLVACWEGIWRLAGRCGPGRHLSLIR